MSCSGDVTCPPNFTTTDTIARSYTITNLAPMTNYTFSVVATNSIGSGEAGVVMITISPSEIILCMHNVYKAYCIIILRVDYSLVHWYLKYISKGSFISFWVIFFKPVYVLLECFSEAFKVLLSSQ